MGAFEAPPRPAVGFVASSLLLAYDARDPAPVLRLAHIDFAHVEALPSGEVRFFPHKNIVAVLSVRFCICGRIRNDLGEGYDVS